LVSGPRFWHTSSSSLCLPLLPLCTHSLFFCCEEGCLLGTRLLRPMFDKLIRRIRMED
jgi:hypothetical protein